ncbi:MAG: hypothetical protein AAF674_03600 [Pseudomonadota bacterium]
MLSVAPISGPLVKPLHRQMGRTPTIGEQIHNDLTTTKPKEIARQVIDNLSVAPEGGIAQRSRAEAEANRRPDHEARRAEVERDTQRREARRLVLDQSERREDRRTEEVRAQVERADDRRERKLEESRARTAHLDNYVPPDRPDRPKAPTVERTVPADRPSPSSSSPPPQSAGPTDLPPKPPELPDRRAEAAAAAQFRERLSEVRAAQDKRYDAERRQLNAAM